MKTKLSAVLVAVVLLAVTRSVCAHHSQSVYDDSKEVVLSGTATKFVFANPHVQIHFQVKDSSGNVVDWMAQGSSPNSVRKQGWTRATIKPGDQVVVSGHAARNGRKEMHIVKLELNGRLIREVTPDGPRQINIGEVSQGK